MRGEGVGTNAPAVWGGVAGRGPSCSQIFCWTAGCAFSPTPPPGAAQSSRTRTPTGAVRRPNQRVRSRVGARVDDGV